MLWSRMTHRLQLGRGGSVLGRARLSIKCPCSPTKSYLRYLLCPFYNGFIEKGPSTPVSVFFHFKDLGELYKHIVNQL